MKYLGLFPLELVVFPTEKLALHIFEERYKQLINDCESQGIHFGIPIFLENKIRYGTLVRLVEIVKQYPDKSLDIICEGLKVFEVHDFDPVMPGKLYAGGHVTFKETDFDSDAALRQSAWNHLELFYNKLAVAFPEVDKAAFNSFTLAHKIGLTLEQEEEFLLIREENKRLDYIINHIKVMLTTITAVSKAKELIRLNGHFKHFDPLDFKNLDL